MKRLKTRVLFSITLISAFVKAFARFHNFLLCNKRFRLTLLKPIIATFMLVIGGLLFSAKSFGAVTITTMSVGPASTTATYGTSTKITYTVTYTATGTGGGTTYTLGLNTTATGLTIADVNGAAGTTFTTTTAGTNKTFTISITTSATTTQAGGDTFTVKATNGATTVTSTGTAPTLTVNKLSLTIDANNQTKTYGTTFTFIGNEYTITAGSLKNSDAITSVTFACPGSVATATVAGSTYTITASNATGTGLSNYSINYTTGTMTVNKAALTITNISIANKTYNGNTNATITGTATLNGVLAADASHVALGGTATATFSSKHVANGISVTVSGYTISGTASGNYILTRPTGLSANITTATLSITASTVNKTYGTGLTSGSVTTGFISAGLAAGDALGSLTMTYGTGGPATANVGTYTGIAGAVPSAAANNGTNFTATDYSIAYNDGNIVCGTAPLTIKANNQTKTYGNTFTFTGNEYTITAGTLKNTDAINSATITSTGAVSTASVAGSPYPIAISNAVGSGGFLASNYNISYTAGTMTLTGVAITIAATGPTVRYYGQVITTINNSTNFTVSGTLITGQSITTVTLTGDGNAQNYYQGAGSAYHITPSNAAGTGFVASNYNITYVAYAGTIAPAPITITATGPTTKVYGTALTTTNNSTTNFTETGNMAPLEQIQSVTLTPSGPGAAANAPVGSSYTVTPSAAADYFLFIFSVSTSNYAITYVGFTSGTITPAPLTITANAVSKAVGVTLTSGPGSTEFTSSGLVGTETIGSVTITYGAAAAAGAAVGAYTNQVTPSAATAGTFLPTNYNITYKSNTLTVVSGIYDWTGAVSADWATPQNWNINGVQQTTTYPGLNVATDVVQVGVVAYTGGNQPTLAATPPFAIASINFGPATTPGTLNLNASVVLPVTGNFTLKTGAEVVNLNGAGGSSLNIGGDYVSHTGSTFNNNSAAVITISGLFTNSGTSNFGTSLLTFNNPSTTVVFNTATSQLFTNVLFTGGGHITLNHSVAVGQFSIASTGVITLGTNETLTINTAPLTLLSDANGSATVATLPSGASITGNVSVQRYLQAVRAYRLVSSPVYASTVSGNNVYSINYLQGSAPLTGTGGTTGGFDKAGNPTLYLYRENLAPQFSSFLNSNFRGINNIATAPTYGMDDTTYASTNIPVGNGYLFYFRGSLHQFTLANLTKAGAAATNDTLSTTGILNQGTITVANWYTPGSTNLGFTTVSDTTSVEGSNLVGNPYASSIDWDQSDSTNTAAPIYVPHIAPFSYQLILTGQGAGNYNVYQAGNGGVGTVNTVNSNIIPSGEGFFVFATGTGASLTFTEAAKTNAQVTGSNLYLAKRLALSSNTQQSMRFQLSMDTLSWDGTIIRFNANAHANYNRTEDATYRVGTGKVSLSSLSGDRRSLAINQLPFAVKGQKIPLNVSAAANGTYSLGMTRITGVSQLFNVWLKDNYLKDSVDMRASSSYSFSILHSDTGTFGPNRFVVLITQNPAYKYQLMSFDATKMSAAREVKVAWKTQYEDNYTQFMVERSVDNGKTFEEIGSLNSNAAGAYYFMDQKPTIGQNLYRLKQVDMNSNLTYSAIVQVSYSDLSNNLAQNNISIFPNPTTSNINLAVLTDAGANLTYNIKITNSTGFVIKQATTNQPSLQLNVSGWLPGTYLVRVFNNKDQSEVGTTKFIKL
jgi:trimeric autotransporter adhesin